MPAWRRTGRSRRREPDPRRHPTRRRRERRQQKHQRRTQLPHNPAFIRPPERRRHIDAPALVVVPVRLHRRRQRPTFLAAVMRAHLASPRLVRIRLTEADHAARARAERKLRQHEQ